MFCVNCGKAYERSYKFCNHCGYPLPSDVDQSEGEAAHAQLILEEATSVEAAADAPDTHDDGPTLEPALAPPPLRESAPYARFVSLVLGSALFVSVVIFNVADGFARNHWETTISTAIATVVAVLLARSSWGAWRRVVGVEPETDAIFRSRHRRVLRNSAIIIIFFFTTAAIVGAAIGQSRADAIQLATDLEQMNTVGDRISKARNAVEATIPSYVQMYKGIEPDVQELDSTFRRLKAELGAYDGKFPAQHEGTAKSIAAMETGLRRMALLKQQIEVSENIQAIDPNQQLAEWKALMLPLLASEEALDKTK